MKIIDANGKLFGKINVIDFTAILFLLCLLPLFYFGYRIMYKKYSPEALEKLQQFDSKSDIELICRFVKLKPDVLKLISVGDKEYDYKGRVVGEIMELGEISPHFNEIDIGEGQRIIKEDPDLKQARAKVKLIIGVKNKSAYYRNMQVVMNEPLDFTTSKYKVTMIPVATPVVDTFEERELNVNITLKNLDEETIKRINQGDKDVTDTGEVAAEILSIGKIENDTYLLNLGVNNYAQGENSLMKQCTVNMRLKFRIKDNNQIYFKGKRVESDVPIEFNTGKYKVKGIFARAGDIEDTSRSGIKEKWINLRVKFIGVIPELAKIISAGDKEKDGLGKTVGVLRDIISIKASDVLILKEDKFITVFHPFQKDIMTIIDVLCIEKEGILYYKNYPVKMGNLITFATDLYSLSGTITGMNSR